MAENRRNRRDSRSRNKQKKSHGNSPKKELLKRHAEYFESAKKQAWDRFDLDPLPIGIPEEPAKLHGYGTIIGTGNAIMEWPVREWEAQV